MRAGRRQAFPFLRFLVVAAAVLFPLLVPEVGRAETYLLLLPKLGLGVTNNPGITVGNDAYSGDEFALVSITGHLNTVGPRWEQALGYRFSYTRFRKATQADTMGNELSYLLRTHFTASWLLDFAAEGIITQTSQILTTGALGMPSLTTQAAVGGSTTFVTTQATEGLSFTPTQNQFYREVLQVDYLNYLDGSALPTTVAVQGLVDGDWLIGRNTYSLEVQAGGASTTSNSATVPTGDLTLAGGTAGWRRQLSGAWASALRLGAVEVLFEGGSAFEPIGSAALDYRRPPWFATLSVSRLLALNLFTGGVTVDDRISLVGTVPLDRHELLLLSGHASYAQARPVGDQNLLTAAFDQWTATTALTGRHPRLPLWMALEYTLVYQTDESRGTTIPVSDLLRHTILLSIGGALLWGHDTSPELVTGSGI